MLGLSPRVGVIHEPFNPLTPPGVCSVRFDRFFRYVTAENEAAYLAGLRRTAAFRYNVAPQLRTLRSPRDVAKSGRDLALFTQARLRHARPLLKDPIAFFSSEWVADRLGADVVVLVRHPAAFVGSLKHLGWTHDFSTFLDQPLLLRDLLGPFEDEIRAVAADPPGLVEQSALLWRIIYATALGFRERHPGWIEVRHEDLSRAPGEGFGELYGLLELPYDAALRGRVEDYSKAENPTELRERHDVRLDSRTALQSWRRRLAPDEIDRVREATQDVWPAFYGEDDW
jgi:hypothetical protein